MGLLGRKPNVESLARNEDVVGLLEAASYRELVRDPAETDLGIPVRTGAILALGELGADAGQEAVESALRDPADLVRCAAVRVLFARKEAGALLQALRWLPAGNGQSRTFALRAVSGLRQSVTPAGLADALVHGEDEELLNEEDLDLLTGLLEEGSSEAEGALIELLMSALRDGRGIVADRAGELLLRLAPASTETVVAELREGQAAAEAAYVLGRIADPQTLDALAEGLGHDDPRVRAESAAALAELQDPAAVKPLLKATHDPDHGVRNQAGLAIDRLGSPAVIVGVAALLEPMILKAVQSVATAGPKPARRQSNGGPPRAADTRSIKKPPAA